MISSKAKALKEKVGSAVGAAMSLPATLKAKRLDRDISTIKTARAYDKAPDMNDDGMPSQAFKARAMSRAVKQKYLKK